LKCGEGCVFNPEAEVWVCVLLKKKKKKKKEDVEMCL
jgi:hypothetical protein